MTFTEYQTKTAKGDRLSGDLASLLRTADLGGWVATLNLQAKRIVTGTHDPEISRRALAEALWHLTQAATHMGLSLETAAELGMESQHGV